jgi:hypothetical protein
MHLTTRIQRAASLHYIGELRSSKEPIVWSVLMGAVSVMAIATDKVCIVDEKLKEESGTLDEKHCLAATQAQASSYIKSNGGKSVVHIGSSAKDESALRAFLNTILGLGRELPTAGNSRKKAGE